MNNPEIDSLGNKCWYNKYGRYHREDGPALELSDGTIAWYQYGKLHKTDGPAVEYYDGHKEYWLNGKRYDSLEEGLMDFALE